MQHTSNLVEPLKLRQEAEAEEDTAALVADPLAEEAGDGKKEPGETWGVFFFSFF